MAGYAGRDAVIVGAVRTPVGKGKASGALHDVLPVDLLAHSLTELVTRTGIDPAQVDDVIAGAVVGTWAALTVLDTDRSIMKHLTREFTIGSVEFQFLPRMNPRGITVLQARW